MVRRERWLHTLGLMGFTLALSGLAAFGILCGNPGSKSPGAFGLTAFANGQTQLLLAQDKSQVQGKGAEIFGNRIQITQGGIYVITGSLLEGQIYVAAGEEEMVTLVLAGAEVTNASEAALQIECAGEVELLLAKGTQNRLQSGEARELDGEADTSETGESKGAVYGNCDLNIQGDGSLKVLGYRKNGIHTTGKLKIKSGSLRVEAVNNGIRGKDSVTVQGGDLEIESQGDALQAETSLTITGGKFQITAGGGSEHALAREELREKPLEFQGERRPDFREEEEEEDTKVSAKGFKCKTRMEITGGSFWTDTKEDAFHSDGSILIKGGSFFISSGDDGMHANTELTVLEGAIHIDKCYEGLEANQLLIGGGELSITASDDGVNAYGGSDGFGREESAKVTGELPTLCITGGKLTIDADGDGLDSNGDLRIEGGEVVVNGPSDNGNGAIDSGSENGGICRVNGGTVLAVGSSGMAETFDEDSGQNSFCCNASLSFEAGEEIRIEDSRGNLLYSHTAVKSGNSVVFSSPKLALGETYTLSVGSERVEICQERVSTGQGGQGGFPGRAGNPDALPQDSDVPPGKKDSLPGDSDAPQGRPDMPPQEWHQAPF